MQVLEILEWLLYSFIYFLNWLQFPWNISQGNDEDLKLPPLIHSSWNSQYETPTLGRKAQVIFYGAFCRGYLCGTLKERVNSPTLVFSVIPVQVNLTEKLSTVLSLKIKQVYLALQHAPNPLMNFLSPIYHDDVLKIFSRSYVPKLPLTTCSVLLWPLWSQSSLTEHLHLSYHSSKPISHESLFFQDTSDIFIYSYSPILIQSRTQCVNTVWRTKGPPCRDFIVIGGNIWGVQSQTWKNLTGRRASRDGYWSKPPTYVGHFMINWIFFWAQTVRTESFFLAIPKVCTSLSVCGKWIPTLKPGT